MKLFAVAIALVGLVAATQCQAQDLGAIGLKNHYRSGSSKSAIRPKLTVEEFQTLWKSKAAVCVQGSSPFMANDTFSNSGLKYRDCSESEAKRIEHADRGVKVYVIKKHQLPKAMYKKKK